MMDGDFNFNSGVIGGVRYAALLGEMPEFIIVGIKNTDRSKDIFPEEVTYRDGSKDGGRADRYLDFIREELIPHIDKTYRTEKFRVLYGTSNTGFTTVYALFRNPDMADAYIAASATLSIPLFRAKRDEWIRDFKGGKRRLVAVMGENDLPTVLSQNGALKEALDTLAPPDLTCRFRVIENGGHVPADSLQQGLSAPLRRLENRPAPQGKHVSSRSGSKRTSGPKNSAFRASSPKTICATWAEACSAKRNTPRPSKSCNTGRIFIPARRTPGWLSAMPIARAAKRPRPANATIKPWPWLRATPPRQSKLGELDKK